MTDGTNFQQLPDEPASVQDRGRRGRAPAAARRWSPQSRGDRAGVEISGSGAIDRDRRAAPHRAADDPDPSVAMSGQVGSQIKIASGRRWLLANVRRLKVTDAEAGVVVAEIDFLGEGDEEPSTGKLVNFKRGITAYPIPGSKVYPVTGSDLKQMFAADERAHIEIGTVYPTKDVRAALYVDAVASASISPCWARPAPASRPRPP